MLRRLVASTTRNRATLFTSSSARNYTHTPILCCSFSSSASGESTPSSASSSSSTASISTSTDPATAYSYSPPTEFLSGISKLINASRTSTTRGLWQMRAQEREDMDSHLDVRKNQGRSPLTPIEQRSAAADPSSSSSTAAEQQQSDSQSESIHTKPKPSNPFPPILPIDSFWSVSLPFDSDLSLYDDYVRFDGGVRFERILEDLDAFAGNVAHLHVKKGVQRMREMSQTAITLPDMSIVTASVDSITMNPKMRFPMDKHVALQGCITWVGSSSMEIWIEMRIVRDPRAWAKLTLQEKMEKTYDNGDADDVILNAFFLMVARDQRSGKAAFVPPLDSANMNENDLDRFHRGEASAVRRKAEAANSLTRQPPTADEVKLIHNYILSGTPDISSISTSNIFNPAACATNIPSSLTPSNLEISAAPSSLLTPGAVIIRPRTVPMSETEMSSATMTQPQDRNTNGKIFGGMLMRNAYELARCNSYIFCGAASHPYFTSVDQISFLKPVEIGSIISFRSKICYAAGPSDTDFQVRVETLVHDLIGGKTYESNVFHFTFQCVTTPVRRIIPTTYREAVDYLDGKRRREKLAKKFEQMKQDEEERKKKKQQKLAAGKK